MNMDVKKVLSRSFRVGLALSLTAGVLFSGISFASDSPNAPAGIRLSDVTGSGFKVSWNAAIASANIAKYQVFNGTSLVQETTANSYTLTDLDSAKVYPISVKACNAQDVCSATSAKLSARTSDIVKPAAPTKLTVSNITTTGFRLNWSESTDNVGVKGYKVFLNDSEVANHSKSQYYATGLNPGTTYDLRVSAYDQAGNESDFSVTKFVNTLPSAPPPPDTIQPSTPQNLVATNVTMTSFRVNWSYSIDNVGIKEYEVYRNGVLMGTTPHLTFFFAGIVPNSTSLIRLVAVDHAGNKSSLSSVLAAKTLTGIALTEKVAPATPGNVAASSETTSGFTLNWNKSTDNVYVLGYNIYLNGKYHASVSGASYTFTGLSASTNYNVQILAYDVAKNRSGLSTNVTALTK